MKFTYKTLFPLIAQVIVITMCFILISKLTLLPPAALLLVKYSSYIIFLLGIILSILFNRGRVFFIIVFLLIYQFLLFNYRMFSFSQDNFSNLLYPIAGILIPINIAIFSQLKERGIFSLWGKIRIFLIIVELYFTYETVISKDNTVCSFVNFHIPILTLFKAIVPTTSLVCFLLAFIFFLVRIIIYKSTYEIRISGVLLSTLFAFFYIKNTYAFSIFFAAAGIILVTGIVKDSYSMAYLDELTSLPSRRALRETLMKLGNKYSIAMLDIDFFKKFNDTYGHDVGDEVLKLVASNLESITGGGKPYRYGGEEFTIVFPGKNAADVIPDLEKLRERVSKAAYTNKKGKNTKSSKKLFVTISIGVCEKSPKFKTPDEVMKAADNALYRAKEKGRNCVSK